MRTVNLGLAPRTILSYAPGPGRPVILLDGGSGAGKTSLAAMVLFPLLDRTQIRD